MGRVHAWYAIRRYASEPERSMFPIDYADRSSLASTSASTAAASSS